MSSAVPVLSHQHYSQPIEPLNLRRACGLFVTGVTVITTGSARHAEGTTVNSFASVSLEPPLVLFCIHRRSRLLALLEDTGGFAVNFLARHQEVLARHFAAARPDSFADVPHRIGEHGLPVLTQAPVHLACTTVDTHAGGDHNIVVGEVVHLAVPDQRPEPLVFFEGALGPLATTGAGAPRGSEGAQFDA